MKTGDIVKYRGKFAEIMDVLPNSVIIDNGLDTIIASKHNVEVAFKIDDHVYVRDTNKSFTILGFSYRDSDNEWVAMRNLNTSNNFHMDVKECFQLKYLEQVMVEF